MAKRDEFDLDFDLNGASDDDFDFPSDNGNETQEDYSDFESAAQTAEISEGKSTVIKQAAIIAVIGIILILVAIVLVRALTGGSKKPKNEVTQPSSSYVQQPVSNQSSDEWSSFTKADGITYTDNYISSKFVITGIKHYVKVIDKENNLLMIKTTLTGTLNGFNGTYTLDVPYSKGSLLYVGNMFNVEVKVGEYNGKQIIDEIRY